MQIHLEDNPSYAGLDPGHNQGAELLASSGKRDEQSDQAETGGVQPGAAGVFIRN